MVTGRSQERSQQRDNRGGALRNRADSSPEATHRGRDVRAPPFADTNSSSRTGLTIWCSNQYETASLCATTTYFPASSSQRRKLGLGFVNWRCLRTSRATWLNEAGADLKDVQGQMRHSRVQTTLDIYVQFVPESAQSITEDKSDGRNAIELPLPPKPAERRKLSTELDRFGPKRGQAMTVSDCKQWWPGTELNRRRQPFQGCALPAELPGHDASAQGDDVAAVEL